MAIALHKAEAKSEHQKGRSWRKAEVQKVPKPGSILNPQSNRLIISGASAFNRSTNQRSKSPDEKFLRQGHVDHKVRIKFWTRHTIRNGENHKLHCCQKCNLQRCVKSRADIREKLLNVETMRHPFKQIPESDLLGLKASAEQFHKVRIIVPPVEMGKVSLRRIRSNGLRGHVFKVVQTESPKQRPTHMQSSLPVEIETMAANECSTQSLVTKCYGERYEVENRRPKSLN